MEPLLPSEVARLVFGYLKEEKNEETAECFLKSSVHLSECYQMFKTNRKFNIKFNGFTLHDIFDIFGTMCSMINDRIPEECKYITIIERLQYLLDLNNVPTKEDKCVTTESNMIDKCVGDVVSTQDKSTCTLNENMSEILEMPSFTEMMSSNVSKEKEIDTLNETSITVKKNILTPCLSSTTQLTNNASTPNLSKNGANESNLQINRLICSTPTKNNIESILHFSPNNIDNQLSVNELECQKIPKATSLESMPGWSKEEEEPKNGSVVVDTCELVDTFLNDQSLLEKLADTINKSIEAQKEADDSQKGKFLDPPTLEKALDSTRSDPQIKNVLDEFLVFNVENSDDNKKTCAVDQNSSIKSRLRSAKKKDVTSNKLKKTSSDNLKQVASNEECKNTDNNIVFYIQGENKETIIQDYDLVSNQILQSNGPNVINNLNPTGIVQEDYITKYVKIAPKSTSTIVMPLVHEKSVFPKRKKLSLEQFAVKSKFRKTNVTSVLSPVIPQVTQSIIIEVPNRNSFEINAKNNIDNITRLPEVSKISSKVKDTHDTPDDTLKPPKSKSMSTPRRRSTHIRCLDFSTPQPKNNVRGQVRSKLFCDSPKRCEKILEKPASSPLPKLQADWGSVNGFESIVSKVTTKHWDSDIREMVGAGIFTSNADGRKTRKKKIPRKRIKTIVDKNNSEHVIREENESNNSMLENESQSDTKTNKSNAFKSICDINEQNSDKSLLDDEKSLKKQSELPTLLETSNKVQESYFKQPLDKSSNNRESLENHNEFLVSLNTPDKNTELYNKKPIESNLLKSVNDKKHSEFPISLETPDKITELFIKQPIESSSVKNLNDKKIFQKHSEFSVPLETPVKITESCNRLATIESNSLKILHQNSSNLEPPETDINEQENNLNELNTLTTTFGANKLTATSNSKTISETAKKSAEKDTNFLETLNSHNYLKPLLIKQPKNNMNNPIENVNKQISSVQIESGHSNEMNSPVKYVDKIQPVNHLVETPFKCDNAAIDVPETPISKLIREYDPNKLITPLPCTPEHNEESLTETPLTKVFRETSYLNRPPISPFPPTPGNSRSVDTLLVPSDQERSKPSNGTCSKINGLKEFSTRPISEDNEPLIQTKKVKCTPIETKPKPLTKSKIKNYLKEKSIEAKKKQIYESVKIDLFGSEISSSSSADELENTNQQSKPIVINKIQEEDKKSGFKPIPKRKSIQSTSVLGNVIENGPLDECKNTKICKSLPKPAIVSSKDGSFEETKNALNNKKSKKCMVHFDDPVGKIIGMSTNSTLNKSKRVNINKVQNKVVTNENPEQLIGLSRYLNRSVKFDECSYTNKKRSETIKCGVETSRLKSSDSINNLYTSKRSSSDGKIFDIKPSFLNDRTKTYDIKLNLNRSSDNCLINESNESNRKEKSTALKKCTEPLNSVKPTFTDAKTSDQNSISIKPTASITSTNKTNQSDSSVNNSNNNMNNTSCITIGHSDESYFQLRKFDVPLNNIEYLKRPKVYEVISEDDCHVMIHLHLSESFTFLDIPSELDSNQVSTSIVLPLITNNKALDITPEIEINELLHNDMPATSTPKDIDKKQINERQNRERRSPSFWDDSVHNYPTSKYRNDRHWESNRRKNIGYRDNRHDSRYRSKSRNHSQWSHHVNIKREFRDESVRDKERSKYKEDKRRSYCDYNNYNDRKGRSFEESKRFSYPQRMLQNDIPKKVTKRPADRTDHKIPAKVSKVEHQRLLKNVNVDDFLSVVHGQK